MNWRAFFAGMGSVLDLSGGAFSRPRRQRPKILTDEEAWAADGEAILSDWQVVGEDMRRASERLRREVPRD